MKLDFFAEKWLRTLGKEDLLYTHHGDVHARSGTYRRLAELVGADLGHDVAEYHVCNVCGKIIGEGVMVGSGDGAGRKFAHRACVKPT